MKKPLDNNTFSSIIILNKMFSATKPKKEEEKIKDERLLRFGGTSIPLLLERRKRRGMERLEMAVKKQNKDF
jgi:hypothetical protein